MNFQNNTTFEAIPQFYDSRDEIFRAFSKLDPVIFQTKSFMNQPDITVLPKSQYFGQENRLLLGQQSTQACDDKSESAGSAIDGLRRNENVLPEVKLLLSMQKICPSSKFFKKSKKNHKKTKEISKIKPKNKNGSKLIISIPLNFLQNDASHEKADVKSQKSSGVVSLKF